MIEEQKSYKQIFKATTIFGSVQVINLFLGIIKSKLIALFIGASGLGIYSILTSTVDLIVRFTSLGLESSAVREIAMFENDPEGLNTRSKALLNLSLLTGLIGGLFMLFFSAEISQVSFGNNNYSFLFVWGSISILIKQITNVNLAVLQGLRKVKDLAKANMFGAIFGIIISVPLFYFFQQKAIISVFLINALIGFVVSYFYIKKVHFKKIKLSIIDSIQESKSAVKLGLVLSFGGLITYFLSYLFQIYLSRFFGIGNVGMYNAGFTILNSYVGIVFTVMSTDYYPKLVSLVNLPEKLNKAVSENIFISLLILTPIVLIFIAFTNQIVEILFSKEFVVINSMLTWAILGMIVKSASWSLGYVILAKGDTKFYLKNSFFFNIILFIFNVVGFYYKGFEGLGMSFLVYYILHFFVLFFLVKEKFKIQMSTEVINFFCYSILLSILTFVTSTISILVIKWTLLLILIVISVVMSIYQLNKKIDLREYFKNSFKK